MSVSLKVDLNAPARPYPHYWELCVGSCHAATILREDVREHIRAAHRDCGFRYLRFHGLFDDDMSVVIQPMMPWGELQISFYNIDCIFDFLWVTCHGRTSAGSQNDVGTIIDRYKICDTLHQWFSVPYRCQNFFKIHNHLSSSDKKRSNAFARFKMTNTITPINPPTTAEGV